MNTRRKTEGWAAVPRKAPICQGERSASDSGRDAAPAAKPSPAQTGADRSGVGESWGTRPARGLTDRQRETLRTIVGWQEITRRTPTVRELGEALGMTSTHGVQCHLRALERRGCIDRSAHEARGLRVTVLGELAARGQDIRAPRVMPREEFVEREVDAWRAHHGVQVDDRRLVVVRAQAQATHCRIVCEALDAGMHVPPHVLVDYPGLGEVAA